MLFIKISDIAVKIYMVGFAVFYITQRIKGKKVRHGLIRFFGPLVILVIMISIMALIEAVREEKTHPIVISEESLHGEFTTNEYQAEETYLDKTIYVVGYSALDNSRTNSTYLTVSSNPSSDEAGIKCYFDNTEALNSVDNGEAVLITGICLKDSHADIILNDCDVRAIEFYGDYPDLPTFDSVTGISCESITSIEKNGFSSSTRYYWAPRIVPRDYVLIYCGVIDSLGYYFYTDEALRATNDYLTEPSVRWNSVYAIYYNDESNTQIYISNSSYSGLYLEIYK